MPVIVFIAMRFGLAALFLYAGLQKIRIQEHFYATIVAFQLVPEYLARLLARLLPAVEVGCALALLLGIATRWMAFALLSLLLVFSGALATAWWRHLSLACHCFGEAGPGEVSSFPRSLLRNAGLGSVALGIGLAPAPALRLLFPALLVDRSYQLGLLGALMALTLLVTTLALWTVGASFRKQQVLE
uniref:Methylamine utilisation protein MauE domain-containing protein n=1 Tax=Thermogemmatispora argillosa TaxID=2045280 RepID=A0A455SWX7_9CHLR|nr:hypothetical protein KTA_02170 [Thermogemmatispora argillosa]